MTAFVAFTSFESGFGKSWYMNGTTEDSIFFESNIKQASVCCIKSFNTLLNELSF